MCVLRAHEDLNEQADEEIRRLSQAEIRIRKLSSRADGSWGSPPVRVGRCQVRREKISRNIGLFIMELNKNRKVF
ncbi:hypothetical protein WQ54_18535 [Bacillus sp. SA1-12]|nr:hypothetical protein WQ54_18535 [Bacillus sp. SA1-12]